MLNVKYKVTNLKLLFSHRREASENSIYSLSTHSKRFFPPVKSASIAMTVLLTPLQRLYTLDRRIKSIIFQQGINGIL